MNENMELSKISRPEQLKLQQVFDLRSEEFRDATRVFDTSHLLALQVAEISICYMQECAKAQGSTQWALAYPHAMAVVYWKKSDVFAYSYKINGATSSREEIKIAVAVNALIEAETHINRSK
jgi:hypothetical protein